MSTVEGAGLLELVETVVVLQRLASLYVALVRA